MAKKETTPKVETVEVVAYDLQKRGFFSIERTRTDGGEWSALPPGMALVRDADHHNELLAASGDFTIEMDGDGCAKIGQPFQAEIPPGMFWAVADGQRRQGARSYGYSTIADALALMNDAEDMARLRAWAQAHNAKTNELAPLVASGEMLPSEAIAQLPVLESAK